MTQASSLLVPIETAALVVNPSVRRLQHFRRWYLAYGNATNLQSPEPPPFSGGEGDFNQRPENEGVYLHWTVPAALREGNTDFDFPEFPNRWLIVRYSGPTDEVRTATGWVVESDYTDPNDGTTPFLDPNTPGQRTLIGRAVPLNTPQWSEPTAGQPLFLDAWGAGDPFFTAFQPNVRNVLSFHDPLDGIEAGMLSYCIIGWYSNPDYDPVNVDPADFADTLAALNWQTQDEDDTTAPMSLYHGMVTSIDWQPEGAIPDSDRPAPDDALKVAVGNTTIDALTALVQAYVDAQHLDLDPQLLEAFQYGLVDVLDQPGGDLLVDLKIHQAWFGATPGGRVWEIADVEVADPTTDTDSHDTDGLDEAPIVVALPDADELAKEAGWLATLNQQQAAYETALRDLLSLQYSLYETWWKNGVCATMPTYPDGTSAAQFAAALDPADPGSLVCQVAAQYQVVAGLAAQIPMPEPGVSINDTATQWAMDHHDLPASRCMKSVEMPRFWHPNEPVVLLDGANSTAVMAADAPLVCRFPDQEVDSIDFDDWQTMTSMVVDLMPVLDTTNTPSDVPGLLQEFYMLDPTNADLMATQTWASSSQIADGINASTDKNAVYPDFDRTPWRQPWKPLFLEWEVHWDPVPFSEDNWVFDNGTYTWTGSGHTEGGQAFVGRSYLMPQAAFNLKARLLQYLDDNYDADLEAIEELLDAADDWRFISQTLTGFNDALALRNPLSNWVPDNTTTLSPLDYTMAALVGDGLHATPIPGITEPLPFLGYEPSSFQPVRCGHFTINRLWLVDAFGQRVEFLKRIHANTFTPLRAVGLTPDVDVTQSDPQRYLQLPPRILFPARMRFNLVDANDDTREMNLDAGVNPICGWLLPNHLDGGLTFYSGTGQILGELDVGMNRSGESVVLWRAADGSTIDNPHLDQFINALKTLSPDSFTQFMDTVDKTLWAVDPLGGDDDLAMLAGRPLALVRARMGLELDGDLPDDPTWRYTFDQPTQGFVNHQFPVQLGEQNLLNDGVIGYFSDDTYSPFNSVYPAASDGLSDPDGFIAPVGVNGNYLSLSFADDADVFVSILLDPRGDISVQSAILPAKTVSVPAVYIDPVLASLALTFRTGPLLTTVQTRIGDVGEPDGDHQQFIPAAVPVARNGTWTWVERTATGSAEMDLARPDTGASLLDTPVSLREGLLKLTRHSPTEDPSA